MPTDPPQPPVWMPGPPPLDKPGRYDCAVVTKSPFEMPQFILDVTVEPWTKELMVSTQGHGPRGFARDVDLGWIKWHFPIPDPPETRP